MSCASLFKLEHLTENATENEGATNFQWQKIEHNDINLVDPCFRMETVLHFRKALATATFIFDPEVDNCKELYAREIETILLSKCKFENIAERNCFSQTLTSLETWNLAKRENYKHCINFGSIKTQNSNPHTVQIFVGAIRTCAKRHMIFAKINSGTSSNSVPFSCMQFCIFMLGPRKTNINYLEMGYCMYALMQNRVFFDTALKTNRMDQLVCEADRFFNACGALLLCNPQNIDLHSLKSTLANVGESYRKYDRMLPEAQGTPINAGGPFFHKFLHEVSLRYRHYSSDFRDALNSKCFTAVVLVYFSTFATAIVLGEVLRSKTNSWMGLTEVMLSQCLCGILWGVFSGQPLIIQTTTAAFVIFEGSLYKFCQAHSLEYMVMRVWTGACCMLITIFMVMLEAPVLIRFVTRFTEEVFDVLISVMFIYDGVVFLTDTFEKHPLLNASTYCIPWNRVEMHRRLHMSTMALTNVVIQKANHSNGELPQPNHSSLEKMQDSEEMEMARPNIALLTMILIMATFFMTSYLEKLKNSVYFSRTMRKAIGNFGLAITLPMVSMVATYAFSNTRIQLLDIPILFSRTHPDCDTWFISPLGLEVPLQPWAVFAAFIPAMLVSILLFVELELVEFGLREKDRGLRKGGGCHMDLLLSGILMFLCGIFGLPWLCAAPVQTYAHATALSVHHRTTKTWQTPKVDYVIEQRVTCIVIALFLGGSMFIAPILDRIPVAVVMGVLIYLSIRSLCSIQFIKRVLLFFVPRKYFPESDYCTKVPMWRMHCFTFVQLLCFGTLFAAEVIDQVSVAFPFVVTIMVVTRHIALPLIFRKGDLQILDAGEKVDKT